MKEYKFSFGFNTQSKAWKIAGVAMWIAFLATSVFMGAWFSAGFATCALIDSIFGLISFLYEAEFNKGDEK